MASPIPGIKPIAANDASTVGSLDLGIYNNKSDIDCLVESIKETKKFFNS